jgi:hypothetical protein
LKLKPFIISALVLLFTLSTFAQDSAETHPIQDILSRIPSTESTRQYPVVYIDIPATYQSLDWVDTEENYTYDSFLEAYPDGFRFVTRWASPVEALANVGFGLNPARNITPLDIFNIHQIVSFGFMSDAGTLIRGDFDIEALLSAYENQAPYQIESTETSHFIRNQGEIEPNQVTSNFFDPMMRRGLPLVIETNDSASIIATATSNPFYNSLTTAFELSDSSLWHEPYYQLTAQALINWASTNEAQIVQAIWIPQAELLKREVNFRSQTDIASLPQGLGSLDPENPLPAWTANYREITEYELPVLLADLQLETQQVTLLIVPFDYIGNADFSAQALAERIRSFNNQARAQSETPLVELWNGTVSHSTEQDEESRGVAVVAVTYDAPEPSEGNVLIYQADFFKTVYQSITMTTFYPLWEVTLP